MQFGFLGNLFEMHSPRLTRPAHVTLLTQKAASSLAGMDQEEGPAHVHIRVKRPLDRKF